MTKRVSHQPLEVSSKTSFLSRSAWLIIVVSLIVIPVYIGSSGRDGFRLPKDTLFIAAAVLLVILGAAALFRRLEARIRIRTVPLLATAAIVWTAITTAFSANRTLSLTALVWVVASAVFAIAIDLTGRNRRVEAIAWCLVPAVVNGVVFLLQRFHLWNPIHFQPGVPEHFRYTALVGNPDDVSSFLVGPALVAVALAVSQRKLRALWIATAVVLLLAVGTGQLTAIIACAAALLVMGFMRSRRLGLALASMTVVVAVALVAAYAPLRGRVANVAASIQRHDYAEAFSGRVTPFLAAGRMAARHPLFGVGPSVFRLEFFTYKLQVENAHPKLARAWSSSFNFGEVHDEYLQTLAETGVIGCALLIIAILTIARSSLRTGESERDALVKTLSLPLAVAIAILCVAQFPLHLSAPLLILTYICALCVAWGSLAESRWPAHGTLPAVPRWAAAVAIVAAVTLGTFVIEHNCYWPYVCNIEKNAIYESTDAITNADPYKAAPVARTNLRILRHCIDENPLDIDLYMLAAANYRILGLNEQAAQTYETALRYDRRPEIYYSLGTVELEMKKRPEALGHLLLAVRFSRQYLQDLPTDVQAEINRTLQREFPYLVGT